MSNGRRRKKYFIKDKKKFADFSKMVFVVLVIGALVVGNCILEKHEEELKIQGNLMLDDLYPMVADARIRMDYLEANLKRAESDIEELKELDNFPSFDAEVSWFTAGFESTGKSPGHPEYGLTASGKMVQPSHTIAADGRFPFGTKILIDDIVYVVEDRGGLIYDNRVDIYVENLDDIPLEGRVIKKAYILEWGRS